MPQVKQMVCIVECYDEMQQYNVSNASKVLGLTLTVISDNPVVERILYLSFLIYAPAGLYIIYHYYCLFITFTFLLLFVRLLKPTVALCHGFACWFDADFNGSTQKIVLSTAPSSPGDPTLYTVFSTVFPI